MGIAAGVWILISFVAFAISSQIQKGKLAGGAKSVLHGNPFLLVSPQTILMIGTDARPPNTKEPGAAPSQQCFDQQSHGDAPHGGCSQGQFRADTLMLIRAGGGHFRKLSIPRDSFAEIPGHEPQKINAAYAFGGAKLQIQTVERFLGIQIDHVVIIDFTGFQNFIDAIGGVKVNVPQKLCANISGGAGHGQGGVTLHLGKGDNTLNGQQALAYARIREPSPCPGPGKSAFGSGYDDLDRAKAQQAVISGIKGRLTSPLAAPLQLHPRTDHRLGRAEGVRQRHGLLHDAAADPLVGDRRLEHQRALRAGADALRARPAGEHRGAAVRAPAGGQVSLELESPLPEPEPEPESDFAFAGSFFSGLTTSRPWRRPGWTSSSSRSRSCRSPSP